MTFSCKRSTSSSVFLKKKEQFVIAQLKLQQLKKKHEIDKQYLEIKNKEQLLEAEMQQEQAKICLQIYEEFHNENREKETRNQLEDKAPGMSAFPEVIKTDYLQDTSVREDDRVSILQTSIRNPSNITVSNAAPTVGANPTSATAQAMPILHNTSDLPVQEEYQSSSKVNLIQFEDPLQDLPATVTQQNATNLESIQTDKTEMLMQKLCQVVTNPRMEYLHFDGNPLRYVSFMHNFETCLESQNSDDSTKLQLLIQHCHGRAREAIESCVNLPVEEGYLSAKKTLKENFGKAHIIAKAHLDKLEKFPVIKRADGPSLLDFAQHLEVTYRSLYGMGMDYLSELNHVNTLRTLNKKLPTFLRAKWTDHAGGIIES
ncbi:hypothetical protein SNE40_019846 [Patella caerulea]|uniref:Uncharacterized protein n=1 Tax=Patella caerulea TaxID=87958 RepID=A0AAN8GH97_PATCE